jgi:hypothetical protein
VSLLLLLLSPALAAPGVTISGSCPGPMTVSADRLSPDADFTVLGASVLGGESLPAGPCAGTPSGLDLSTLRHRDTHTADAAGAWVLDRTFEGRHCGAWVQVLDTGTCSLSEPRPLRGEVCDNGVDDNMDGRLDCDDAACAGHRLCHPDDDWVNISGGVMAGTWAYSIAAMEDGTLFVGSTGPDEPMAGVWRSLDMGSSWHTLPLPDDAGVFEVAVSPTGVVFASDWEKPVVYRSGDGGDSWTVHEIEDKCTGEVVNRTTRFAFSPTTGTVFVGAGWLPSITQGVFRSVDGGITWANRCQDPGEVSTIALGMVHGGALVVGGEGGQGVFLSHDDGITWEESSDFRPDGVAQSFDMAVDPFDTYYAANQIPPGVEGGIWSAAGGDVWSPAGVLGTRPMAVEATVDHVVAGTRWDGIHLSQDGGASFQLHSDGWPEGAVVPYIEVRGMVIDSAGYAYAVSPAGSGGVFRSVRPL